MNKHFRITLEIGANKEDNVFEMIAWINHILEDHASSVDHVSVTEITELINQKKECPLMD